MIGISLFSRKNNHILLVGNTTLKVLGIFFADVSAILRAADSPATIIEGSANYGLLIPFQ